ncbi:hypothetical protein N0V83_005741 [Neocucurbitaria cava]|uniref:Uncharacterized protein n=1 Tax=Neocucurbitaria cava TaxID=798079 RepID=A0A9W8Y8E8_9PLEO|nr:hypothetical protein N0V83_005741 [Neocucurbitaria cava]
MAGHEVDDDGYETDQISLTSTVSSIKTETYVVEDILSQAWTTFVDGSEGMGWLVKWEGYPLHSGLTFFLGTWEPEENLDGTDFIQKWGQRKRQMGADAAEQYMAKNEADFKAAEENFIAAKERRRAKRAKKRKSLRAKRRRSAHIVDDDGTQEDVPPRLQEWPLEKGVDNSQLNSLFMDSQDVPTPGPTPPSGQHASGFFVEQPPASRKLPLQQSESSSDAEMGIGSENSDDSLMGELKAKATKGNRETVSAITPDNTRRTTEKPAQSVQKSQPQSNVVPPPRTTSSTHPEGGTAKRTAPTSRTPGGIKFVNKPKTQQRAPWQNSSRLYSSLKFRGIADKRSRAEGTPDPGALDFVNAPPGFVKPRPQPSNDNPYGRRESNTRRVQDDDVDDAPRRGTVNTITPLEKWEADKVPLVCPRWRLSYDCPFGAQKCRYMHRNQDEHGRDYTVGDPSGWLPQKYRKPPLTCPYWIMGRRGCMRNNEECKFAHWNTGWIPLGPDSVDEPFAIDPKATPESEKMVWQGKRRPGELTSFSSTEPHPDHSSDLFGPIPYLKPAAGANVDLADGRRLTSERNTTWSSEQATNEQPPLPLVEETLHEQLPLRMTEQPPAKMSCLQMKAKIEQACTLDFTSMFNHVDRKAFLLFHPEEHAEELDLIVRWLLMHHVEVGNAWYDGSWDYFKHQILRGGSGVIIAHPDFEYFTALPGLGQVLQKPVRLWSVGVQEGIEYDSALTDAPPELRQDRIEIFPLGGFIYITDEVFTKQPQIALRIVQSFFTKIEKLQRVTNSISPWYEVDDLLWRLCVRPELMGHLFQHCEDHAQELDGGNPDVQSIAQLYTILSETNYVEQDDPTAPLSLVPDKYPIISERRIIAEVQPVDYFNTLARSQEDANLHMIRLYAGLQVDLRRTYRQFFVVHAEPEATCVRRWKEEIQTIAEVISPEKCLEELEKEGADGMFDFYESYMSEIQVNDPTDIQMPTQGVQNLAV